MSRWFALLAVAVWPALASAQDAPPPPAADPAPAPDAAPTPEAAARALEERLEALETENAALRDRVDVLEEDAKFVEQKVDALAPVAAKLTGFLDVGFFSAAGDGTGIRSDTGNVVFPEWGRIPDSWVFMGDPLSTAVNARGEPANTGESRAVQLDAIDARASSFLVNSLNVGLFAEVGDRLVFTAKLDFVPRGRDVANPDGLFLGDYLDLRLGYLEYRVAKPWVKLSLFAGKFDSVVGIEYRTQEAPARIEVTPSLICRYTCGYPIGVKARAGFAGDALVLNVAVTNGSHSVEQFPFNNEIDANDFKTVAGRLSYAFPFAKHLELGVSGVFGAQDGQIEDDVYQWMWGADLRYQRHDFVFRAEYVKGRADGQSEAGELQCGLAPCLRFQGAYGLVAYRITNIVMPYVRVDWRDALHRNGASFVYISELIRFTPGLHLDMNEKLTFKAEYTINHELGRIPQFDNDVLTTSLVMKY